jgi:hypothetical protein
MMDDIEILKLENQGLRIQNKAISDEIRILRRYKQIIERSTAIVDNIPTVVGSEIPEESQMPLDDEPLFTMLAE